MGKDYFVHSGVKHNYKFNKGDLVTLIKPLKTTYCNRHINYPKGTNFILGDINIRHSDDNDYTRLSNDDIYEMYSYTLLDKDNNEIAVVGQYMFDIDVADRHKDKLIKLKIICSAYRFIIGTWELLNASLLLGSIAVLMVDVIRELVMNPPKTIYLQSLKVENIILSVCLSGLFYTIHRLEYIKYPKGLKRTLMDRAEEKSKSVYCNYDYNHMAVSD
jgi:hypothetical protein